MDTQQSAVYLIRKLSEWVRDTEANLNSARNSLVLSENLNKQYAAMLWAAEQEIIKLKALLGEKGGES